MKFASLFAAGLLASCGMPTDHLLVDNTVLACPFLETTETRDLLIGFAERNGQKIEVQKVSPTYLRINMTGDGFGHHIFIEQGPPNQFPSDTQCGVRSSSCVSAMVFAGGSIPDDELTQNTVRQKNVAHALKNALVRACRR